MSKIIYIDGLQIERDLEGSDDFAVFEGIMSSDKLNTKYFRYSPEALTEMTRQADEGNGVPIYPLHESYREFNIGRTRSSRMRRNQSLTVFDIQRDLTMGNTTTDDLINRMRTATVDSLSTGTIGGDFLCDLDGSRFEFKSDGMFFFTRQCEQGHRLGDTVKYEGKDQDVTATVYGKPRLFELSVVGAGAVPDAKIIKRLGEMLSTDEIAVEDLHLISEINGFTFDALTERLGVEPVLPFHNPDSEPVPEAAPIPLSQNPEGDTPMAANKELLEQENEALSAQFDAVTKEKAELQEKLDAGCTPEEAEALETQLEDTKTALTEATEKIATYEKSVKDGKVALDYLHTEATKYHISAYYGTDDPTPEELADLKSTIEDTPPHELLRSIKRLKKKTFENREGGRKSQSSARVVSTEPEGYTRSAVS